MKIAKFWVGLIGALAETVVQLAVGGTAQQIATVVVAIATAVTVYLVPNTPAPPSGVTGTYAGRV